MSNGTNIEGLTDRQSMHSTVEEPGKSLLNELPEITGRTTSTSDRTSQIVLPKSREGCDIMHVLPSMNLVPNVEAKRPDEQTVKDSLNKLDSLVKLGFTKTDGEKDGVDELSKNVAADLMKGDFKGVQEILKKLEADPDGKDNLNKLAEKLSNLLGSRVTSSASDFNGQHFSLNFITGDTPGSTGGFMGDTPEVTKQVVLGSSGEPQAYFHNGWGKSGQLDAGTETTRLQALACTEVLGWQIPSDYSGKNSLPQGIGKFNSKMPETLKLNDDSISKQQLDSDVIVFPWVWVPGQPGPGPRK